MNVVLSLYLTLTLILTLQSLFALIGFLVWFGLQWLGT
jgi:hypothetical protein